MKIRVNCVCGRSFATDAKFAGRTTKCPGCGATLVITDEPPAIANEPPVKLHPVDMVTPADMTLDVKIGEITSICGKMNFTLTVHSSGNGHVRIFAFDPSDRRKSGIGLYLDENGYSDLKKIITKLENTIQSLRASNRMKDRLNVRFD